MSIWSFAWVGWLVLFLLIEGTALYRKGQRGTLSWHLWWWLGLRGASTPPRYLWFRKMFLICFTVWLVIHTFSGGWV